MKKETVLGLKETSFSVEFKDSSIRIKSCNKMKKFFGRAFSSQEKISSLSNIATSLGLQPGMNNVSKDDIINFISNKSA